MFELKLKSEDSMDLVIWEQFGFITTTGIWMIRESGSLIQITKWGHAEYTKECDQFDIKTFHGFETFYPSAFGKLVAVFKTADEFWKHVTISYSEF